MTSKLLLLTSTLLLCVSTVFAQGNWELKKDDNGIQVYSRKPLTGNLKELRVVTTLDATENQLIAALQDVGNYTEWVYGNKKSALIKRVDAQTIIYFSEAHLCWPIKDRDLIVQLTVDQNPETKVLNMQAKSLPTYMPAKAGFIRIPYSLANWVVTPVGDNKIKVDYTFSIDPGGSIPAWLVNATLAIGPYNSFVKLRELLKKSSPSILAAGKK